MDESERDIVELAGRLAAIGPGIDIVDGELARLDAASDTREFVHRHGKVAGRLKAMKTAETLVAGWPKMRKSKLDVAVEERLADRMARREAGETRGRPPVVKALKQLADHREVVLMALTDALAAAKELVT